MILIVAFTAFLSWGKPVGPRIMRKLWSNLRDQTMRRNRRKIICVCEEAKANKEWRPSGYPNPEDAEDPMNAPPDYDVRQSGRVMELQNRDL